MMEDKNRSKDKKSESRKLFLEIEGQNLQRRGGCKQEEAEDDLFAVRNHRQISKLVLVLFFVFVCDLLSPKGSVPDNTPLGHLVWSILLRLGGGDFKNCVK
jgi:hypothetical protein